MYITLHVEYRYYGPISMKLQFSRQMFEKCRNIKFYESPTNERRVDPGGRTDGRTDRHDEANSPFSQLCEHVQ